MDEMRLTDDDDGDTLGEEDEFEPKLTDEDDGDTIEVEETHEPETKECCD